MMMDNCKLSGVPSGIANSAQPGNGKGKRIVKEQPKLFLRVAESQ
jgi:hypothetical protein